MEKRNTKIATLIAGVTTALIVVCSHLFCFTDFDPNSDQQETKTEQSQGDADSTEVRLSTPSSLPSSASVSVQYSSSFLFEIFVESDVREDVTKFVPRTINKLFQTLFQVIMAPNAP